MLAGSVRLVQLAPDDGDEFGELLAAFVNGFVVAVCAVPELWSECLTALVRRCVAAWARVEVSPELAEMISSSMVHADQGVLFTAVSTTSVDDLPVGLPDRSREAVHRVTAWLNGKDDLRLGASGSVLHRNEADGSSLAIRGRRDRPTVVGEAARCRSRLPAG